MVNLKSPIQGQIAMLEASPDTMAERILPIPTECEGPPYETVLGGPYVSLLDYYEGQKAVLGFFSRINRGENFRARFRESSPIVDQFNQRYGNAEEKRKDSEKAKEKLDNAAQDKFAEALGYDALRAAELRPKLVVDAVEQKDYDEFKKPYYGLGNKDAKNSFITTLEDKIKKLKKRMAAPGRQEIPVKLVNTDEPTLWSWQLDESRGIIASSLENINPEQAMTFIEFGREISSLFGGGELEEGVDVELHVSLKDFANVEPAMLRKGLYISQGDPRYRRTRKDKPNTTEQLAWVWGNDLPLSPLSPRLIEKLDLEHTGVVLPADEFNIAAHSPQAMSKFIRSRTRDANETNPDIKDGDEKTGRSAGHAMEGKLEKITELIPAIEDEIKLFKTVYGLSSPESQVKLKAKDLEVLYSKAEERLHALVDTARLNLGLNPRQIKAMHRALASRLRVKDDETRARNWRVYASLGAQYAYARLIKAVQSRERYEAELEIWKPFLERGEAAKAEAENKKAA